MSRPLAAVARRAPRRGIGRATLAAVLLATAAARAASFDVPAGADPATALLGPPNGHEGAITREVEAHGFHAGDPVGAGPCAGCHADVAAQWAGSAHRFASLNNPYYAVSFEAFRRERGDRASRFCGACHDPVLVAAGAFEPASVIAAKTAPGEAAVAGGGALLDLRGRREAQAGIVCLVCHSIDDVPDLGGNGGYHVRLAPVPMGRPMHRERLRPPLLGASRLCGSCHKVALTPEVTGDRWLRGQDDYDPWHASSVAGNGAPAIHRAPSSRSCQDCHMPLEPAPLGDAAARPGSDGVRRVRSHRFLGANTALPALRGDTEMLARTASFLAGTASLDVVWRGAAEVDVVLRARGVGHRFPGGTMDSNEVWLEVEARDGAGRVVARSGGRDGAGALDGDSHLVRVQAVDGDARAIALRDPQHARGVVFDTALAPADPQAVRYRLTADAAGSDARRRVASVRARLLYRKLSPAYARYACVALPDEAVRRRCLDLPAVEIARAERLAPDPVVARCMPAALDDAEWERLIDHGLALADALVERASEAEPLLDCARLARPSRPEPLLGLARLYLALGRTDDAVAAAGRAEALAPDHPAALYLRGLALYRAYRHAEARVPIERLARLLPDDRATLVLLARLRGLTADPRGALAAAEHLLALDPDAEEGHYQRTLALRELGRGEEAARAESRYLERRVALETDLDLRGRFRARHRDRPDESVPVHTHLLHPVDE